MPQIKTIANVVIPFSPISLYEACRDLKVFAVCIVEPAAEIKERWGWRISKMPGGQYRAERLPRTILEAPTLSYALEQIDRIPESKHRRLATFTAHKIKERQLFSALTEAGAFGEKARTETLSQAVTSRRRRQNLPLDYVFTWSQKAKGKTVRQVIDTNTGFITWCLGTWPDFLSADALAYYNARVNKKRNHRDA